MSKAGQVTLVLVRHGQSVWNRDNRFTGWIDVGLTEKGIEEAKLAVQRMSKKGYRFDIAYTSVLRRAIHTLWLVLEGMDILWVPVKKHWRLNERQYGALQGLNKAETAERHCAEQVNRLPIPSGAFCRTGRTRLRWICARAATFSYPPMATACVRWSRCWIKFQIAIFQASRSRPAYRWSIPSITT